MVRNALGKVAGLAMLAALCPVDKGVRLLGLSLSALGPGEAGQLGLALEGAPLMP